MHVRDEVLLHQLLGAIELVMLNRACCRILQQRENTSQTSRHTHSLGGPSLQRFTFAPFHVSTVLHRLEVASEQCVGIYVQLKGQGLIAEGCGQRCDLCAPCFKLRSIRFGKLALDAAAHRLRNEEQEALRKSAGIKVPGLYRKYIGPFPDPFKTCKALIFKGLRTFSGLFRLFRPDSASFPLCHFSNAYRLFQADQGASGERGSLSNNTFFFIVLPLDS